MSFSDLIQQLTADTVQKSLPLFAPELCIAGTIVLLLFVRLFGADRWLPGGVTALIGSSIALLFALMQWRDLDFTAAETVARVPFFTGLLIYDPMTVFFRLFLLLFLLLVVYLTTFTGIPDMEDAPDFYTLLLGSTLGMLLMVSANHLLMLFLAVEMTSVPSYAMVGFLKGRKLSSEAALKYVVYGAGAAGVMLYGISLLAGLLGTADMSAIPQALAHFGHNHPNLGDAAVRTLILAIIMVLVGVAFKLSAVPFHFWCPDAFEGASAEVAGYLSVASKAAAFALLVRLCVAIVGQPANGLNELSGLYLYVGIGLGVMAAASTTLGNLAAYAQMNAKRMLAYSTIAHAGYMLMAVAAMMVILNAPSADAGITPAVRAQSAAACVQGLLYYLTVYFFMNLGAFAIVALIRNKIFSEDIRDYAGLVHQSPVLAVSMLICLLSLVGLPPLGGFIGKFMVFASVFEAGKYHYSMWVLLVIGGLNTVFSLFFYLRVIKFMFISPVADDARPVDVSLSSEAGNYVALLSLLVLILGVLVDPISRVTLAVAERLF